MTTKSGIVSSKTIAERELDRLVAVCSEKDIEIALSRIVEWLQSKTSILTLHHLKSFLHSAAFRRKFQNYDFFQQLLERLRITETQWEEISSISQKWGLLHDDPFLDYIAPGISQQLVAFWGAKVKNYSKIRNGVWSFQLEFSGLHLHFFDETVDMIVITDPGGERNQFDLVKNILINHDALLRVSLFLVIGDGAAFRELAKNSTIDMVIVDENDCREILLSKTSIQTFCHQVAKRVSIQTIQPYQIQGKVRNRMFYGRDEEIKRLRSNLTSNFAVYGGRLVGKSSLLHQIGLTFGSDEFETYKVCSITAQKSPAIEVCRNILKKVGVPTGQHKSITTFERLFRDYLNENLKKVIVLLDEVDDLVSEDETKDFEFFDALHNLNNDFHDRCRFIIAGYRELALNCMNRDARLYNFGEKILLGNLSQLSARLLIQEPLCNELGFRFESDDILNKILEITSGHPNYIQVFCKELSEYLDSQRRRKILSEDVMAIYENANFRARIIETFYVNFSPLQQLITALIILNGKTEVDITDIIEMLQDYGRDEEIKNVYVEARQLEMSFVLEQTGTKYRFLNKLFPEMLEKSIDLLKLADHLVIKLAKAA